MKDNRKLVLRREVLVELPDADLRDVAGGAPTRTCFSCYTFISCNPLDCLPISGRDSCIC